MSMVFGFWAAAARGMAGLSCGCRCRQGLSPKGFAVAGGGGLLLRHPA